MMTRILMGVIALSPLVIAGCQDAPFNQVAQNEAEDIFGQDPNDLLGNSNNQPGQDNQPNDVGEHEHDFNSSNARSKIVRALLNVLERLDDDEGSEEERKLVREILEEADDELANSLGDNSLKKIVAANQRKRAFYIPHRTRSKQIAPLVRETERESEQVEGLDQKDDIIDNPQQPVPNASPAPLAPSEETDGS